MLQINYFVCFSVDIPKTNKYNDTCKAQTTTKKEVLQMTIEKLRQITNNLPADTVLLIDCTAEAADVETVSIEYHTDGRAHLILSSKE